MNDHESVCAALHLCRCIYNDLHIRAALPACAWTSKCPWHNRPQSGQRRATASKSSFCSRSPCFFLLAILVSLTAFDLSFLRPGNNQDIAVFAALSALIFLLFVALTFVLLRNLLKLFAERRLGVLGSKFRTRMVAGALLLSFVPVMVMYWFSYGLMNRSIDKWFSTPVEEVRADTHAMASLLASYAMQNARAEAVAIAASPEIEHAFSGHGFSAVVSEFQHHELTLQGGFALAVRDGNAEASLQCACAVGGAQSPIAVGRGGRRTSRTIHLAANRLHAGQRPG